MHTQIGDLVSYREKTYEVLDVTEDNTLIIGNSQTCDDEVNERDVRLVRPIF